MTSRRWAIFWPFILLSALVWVLAGTTGFAKDDDRDRVRFYGWVESMPEGLQGTWVIGGTAVTTGPGTEFDQEEGPLRIGGCVKVDIRRGTIHEIDSEPAEDCAPHP